MEGGKGPAAISAKESVEPYSKVATACSQKTPFRIRISILQILFILSKTVFYRQNGRRSDTGALSQ